ncbi:MAG: ribonucleotide reductase N-terminal alpha domain-containing protein, partial [Chloroflexota bacterium]|nr:ribonucleotide reductase N-terminal alpha domain-containing protein [Chloroflexota bacterium]
MASYTRKEKDKALARSRAKVVQAVFSAAESMGFSDREKLEELAAQVIRRLEGTQPLPGLEGLVATVKVSPSYSPNPAQIRSLVRDVLSPPKGDPLGPSTEVLGSPSGEKSPAPAPAIALAPPPPITSPQGTAGLALSPNAVTVLERRYLKKDSEGRLVETVEQMFRRVAHAIVEAETRFTPLYHEADGKAWEEAFYRVMTQLDFLPNSPTLMNAGTELGQLSACFVIPIADSLSDIFEAIRHTALIHQSGGGTGFSFSRLRPQDDVVRSTGGVASGPVSFMKVFDAATETIKQGGRRRGANMGILNVDHPDILRFITAKEKGDFPNFNISVAVTETFMKAVEQGQDYDLISPRTKQPVGKLNAQQVFDRMVQMAWRTGDPGIVFLDRINRDNPTPALGAI